MATSTARVATMKYSNVIITDDNFDLEHEKLCEIIGIPHYNDFEVYDELPVGFSEQEAVGRCGEELGFSVFVMGKTIPNKGSDFQQAFEVGEVACQFGNMFISKHYEMVI